MSAKKIALELQLKINSGDLTLEELNKELALAKEQMAEIGDDGSDEFKALGQVVKDAEEKVQGFNKELKDTKKGFDKTADAQKEASKGSQVLSTGLRAVGGAFKALGIALVVAALKFLFDALSQNQKVMNAVNTVLETISIVMAKVVSTIVDVVSKVSESSKGFEGLKNVVMGLLTLAITPLKFAFHSISLAVQQAQLAWEQSFFGDDDPSTVKRLTASIEETKESLKEVAVDAVKAGVGVVTNLGNAASEIGGLVSGAVKGISEISIKGAIAQAKTNVELTNSAELAAASLQLLLEKYDRQAEQQRQIRDEERNSIADRMKANIELGAVLEKQEKAMLAQADLQIAAAQAQVAKNKNIDTERALIEALAEKAGVLAAVEGFRSEQKVNDLGLDREKMEMLKAISDSEADLSYERKKFNAEQIEDKILSATTLRALEEERMQEEMLRLEGIVELANAGTQAEVDALIALDTFREESRQANIDADKAVLAATVAANKSKNDKVIKDDKDAAAKKAELQGLALGAIQSIAASIATGNEKEQKKAFQINKALSIGQAIQNTATGVTKAFATGGPAGFITGGLVAAAGAAQIATIANTSFKGSVASVETPDSSALAAAGSQPRAFTSPRVDTSQSTTKVIVTETDIRSVTGNVDGIYNRAVVVE
tara:strand:+ start:592 stop:2571 length:1980 start_codon:yes stop_codon:yes gene_type:complete